MSRFYYVAMKEQISVRVQGFYGLPQSPNGHFTSDRGLIIVKRLSGRSAIANELLHDDQDDGNLSGRLASAFVDADDGSATGRHRLAADVDVAVKFQLTHGAEAENFRRLFLIAPSPGPAD
jgi:hypothetical protein